MKDYFSFVVEDHRSKLVTSNFVKGRRITLRGIGAFVEVEDGKPGIGYSYPCLGPLCALVKKHSTENDFTFNPKSRKWRITIEAVPPKGDAVPKGLSKEKANEEKS